MLDFSYGLIRAVMGRSGEINQGLIWAALGVSSLNMLVQILFRVAFGVRLRIRGVK